MPLDDVATPAIRDDLFDDLWNMGVVEGRAYMMPYLARQNVLAYNKEMFRNAGLGEFIAEGEITAWSLSEWTRILDALSASLPEGSFPMMMYAGSSQGDHPYRDASALGRIRHLRRGLARFNLSAPEGVSALRWIQDGVGRGWFPPHAENLEIEDCSSLFRQGQLAIYMVNNASITRYGDAVGLVNFPGPDADGSATAFASGFQIFDNGDAEKLQVARDFLSFVYGVGTGSLRGGRDTGEQARVRPLRGRHPLLRSVPRQCRQRLGFHGQQPRHPNSARNLLYGHPRSAHGQDDSRGVRRLFGRALQRRHSMRAGPKSQLHE